MFVVWLLIGLVEILFPRRLIDFWTKYMFEDGGDAEVRPWVYSLARLEGIVILLWALRRRAASRQEAPTAASSQ